MSAASFNFGPGLGPWDLFKQLGIVEIGRKLVEVKGRVGHGKYESFVRERLRWRSTVTALNFVRVYELAKSSKFEDFGSLTIDASSLYLIAATVATEEERMRLMCRFCLRPGSIEF